MKYQIVNYDSEQLVVFVKVSADNNFESAQIYPISIVDTMTMSQLETRIIQLYLASRPTRQRSSFSEQFEQQVIGKVNSINNFTIDIAMYNLVQGANSTAQSTATNTPAMIL